MGKISIKKKHLAWNHQLDNQFQILPLQRLARPFFLLSSSPSGNHFFFDLHHGLGLKLLTNSSIQACNPHWSFWFWNDYWIKLTHKASSVNAQIEMLKESQLSYVSSINFDISPHGTMSWCRIWWLPISWPQPLTWRNYVPMIKQLSLIWRGVTPVHRSSHWRITLTLWWTWWPR